MKKIAQDVKLGKGVKIYDFVNLYGCEIGDKSKIGTFVEIQKGVESCKLKMIGCVNLQW
jgi:UDP-3-O-[3-hydroxymyristoyl] glucosamine N-acyltransferase